jgi:hypothetical protein
MAQKYNTKARLKALRRIHSFANEDKNINSDFITDREDYNEIPDVELVKEMEWVEKMLLKHISKVRSGDSK